MKLDVVQYVIWLFNQFQILFEIDLVYSHQDYFWKNNIYLMMYNFKCL